MAASAPTIESIVPRTLHRGSPGRAEGAPEDDDQQDGGITLSVIPA